MFQVAATIQKIQTLADGGNKLSILTQELTPDEMTELFKLNNKFGWFLFKEQAIKEEDINWLYLFLTYCLFSHDYGWEVGLYLYGEGANGKSTLAKAFRNMFSHPRFTSISALEKNFGLMGLIGGNFWWANESDNKTIKTDDLKRIISGEPVEIDIKHQKPETHH